MYQKSKSSWIKHLDFIILDCLSMEAALIIAYLIRHGWGTTYQLPLYQNAAIVMVFIHLFAVFWGESYRGIIRRGYFREFMAVFKHVTIVAVTFNIYLYLSQNGTAYSRTTFILTWGINACLSYFGRILWKTIIKKKGLWGKNQRSLVIVTKKERAEDTVRTILQNNFGDYEIRGLVLIGVGNDEIGAKNCGITIQANEKNMAEYICYNWVDEVFFDFSYGTYDCRELIEKCEEMGITVHQKLEKESELYRRNQVVERMTGYSVLTSSVNIVSGRELVCKRILDIVGGILGIFLTGVLCLVIGPIIYIKSPGPIFFSQWRVGKGGKKFKIYKFRSMYMDAEERKKELMGQNNIKDGLMFKMDNDPRVIKGVGNFIRNTSLDEFPQFLNVLKGDMSLVGTRPPTVDEWEKYELYHRKRLAIKPGLTGMWQISGRSKITDFDEVVALDTKYIKEWSLGLDFKILLKTVFIVLKREGAS